MSEELELERQIVTKIIRQIHDGTSRISDSGQRQLHLVVRERLLKRSERLEVNKEELEALIIKFIEELREGSLAKPAAGKTVFRRSLVKKIVSFFSNTWPFGS